MKLVKISAFTMSIIFSNLLFAQAQIAQKPEDISPLLIGEKLPEASLINKEGKAINLSDKIHKSNSVLVFYRGGWCPYCNLQLAGLAESEEEIIKLGYQIIAVSPDDYRNLKPTVDKGQVNYEVYSDPNGEFIQQVGLAFSATPNTVEYISKKTIGETTRILPVPAVLVINTEGEILFEYISVNYRKRISNELLLAVLKSLK